MKIIDNIKFYIERYHQQARTYIETILIESCTHSCTDYDYTTDSYRFEYYAKGIRFVLKENHVGFVIRAYKGNKQIFSEVA